MNPPATLMPPLLPLLLGATLLHGATVRPVASPEEDPRKAERIARTRVVLEEFLHKQEASGALQVTLDAIDALSLRKSKERWICSDWGCILRRHLVQYRKWNRPLEEGREVAAVDIEQQGHPFSAIVDTARQLAAHDIDLLIVPLPSPFQIYPKFIPGLDMSQTFPGLNPGTTRFLLLLLEEGIEVLPLIPHFVDERGEGQIDPFDGLFYRSNPHWTPRGGELAARLVADYVAQLPAFAERGGLSLQATERRKRNFFPPRVADPPLYVAELIEYLPIRGVDGTYFRAQDRHSPILLLGNSFATIHNSSLSADFCRQLCRFLGRRLDSVCIDGGSAVQVRMAVARRRDDLKGKKLVIWMLPSNLSIGKAWPKVPLFHDAPK